MSLTPTPALREEIISQLTAFDACVRNADLAGAMALFVEDAEALLLGSETGELARGRPAITELLQTLFASPVRLGWVWDPPDVAVHGDVAWLCARGMLCVRQGSEETRRPYRITGVFVRLRHEWRWAHFHGSEPALG